MAKVKILIIEDDPLLIKMYKTKFTMEGFEVMTAGDGQEGWDSIQKNTPNFIIMDVMMPRMSGLQLVETLQAHPQYKGIPVIMLSNLSQPQEMATSLKLGVKEFLLKANFTPSQIVEKVKKYL